ncbi:MAG TPA: HEPN domain-containing protein [Puia sp.]|nr:HEPN domain-containing protein [Puia sp.]
MNREVITSELRNDISTHSYQEPDILDPIIYIICQAMPVEKIFLLGIYPANPSTLGIEYDLLVLFNALDKRPTHELESLILNRCHDFAMISVSVFNINKVNQMLREGNIFFSSICNSEKILFDKDGLHLANSSLCEQRPDFYKIEAEFSGLMSKASAFLRGAISYRKTNDFQLSAFMLHQTVEHTMNAFLCPLMGCRIQTHNLTKLLLYARRFSIRFYEIFPRDTDKEVKLYQTLQKAYIYGRYKNNFQVEEETLLILVDRSVALIALAEFVFKEKIEILQSGRTNIS